MEVNKRNHFSVPSIGAVRNVLRDLMRLSANSKGNVPPPPSKSLQTYISTQPKKQNFFRKPSYLYLPKKKNVFIQHLRLLQGIKCSDGAQRQTGSNKLLKQGRQEQVENPPEAGFDWYYSIIFQFPPPPMWPHAIPHGNVRALGLSCTNKVGGLAV